MENILEKKFRFAGKDYSQEQNILTYMIVSRDFLREIQAIYNPNLMELPYSSLVGSWCLDYFDQYDEAPGKHIQDLFNSWKRKNADESYVELLGTFLFQLSKKYEDTQEVNVNYLLDQAERYFKHRSLLALSEDVRALLAKDKIVDAEAELARYRAPQRMVSGGINPFTNKEAIRMAFEDQQEPLITFPGALGDLINDQLTRDSFIYLLAPEKRGKSFWLTEFAMRGIKFRKNVAFIAVGDMTKNQMLRRIHTYLSKRNYLPKYCGDLLIPDYDCLWNQYDICGKKQRRNRVCLRDKSGNFLMSYEDAVKQGYTPCSFCKDKYKHFKDYAGTSWNVPYHADPLTWEEGVRIGERFFADKKGCEFKLIAYPNKGVNFKDLRNQLDIWEHYDGFIPDLIALDYMDNMAPEDSRWDIRQQINESWQMARALSQERNCLLISASQADSKSYSKKNVSMENFSEDKRKNAHVTAMFGLNQLKEEKKMGIMRFSQILAREGESDELNQVCVMQDYRIGRAYLGSFYETSDEEIARRVFGEGD